MSFWSTLGNIAKGIVNPVGTIASAAGSLIGSISSSNASKKQLQMQQEENEKNRQFNSAEAAIARQFNADQANLQYSRVLEQNEYNSPAQQMKRLKEAGLNPNLAYGDLGSSVQMSGGTAASGSAASSSGTVGTALPDYSLLSGIGKTLSEINLMDAQAGKLRADTKGQEINNSYLPQILEGSIDLNGVNIEIGVARKNLTVQQAREIDSKIALYAKQVDLLYEQWEDMFNTNQIKWYTEDENGDIVKRVNPDMLAGLYGIWKQQKFAGELSEQESMMYFDLTFAQIANLMAQSADANARALGQTLQNVFYEALHSGRPSHDPIVGYTREHMRLTNSSTEAQGALTWKEVGSYRNDRYASYLGYLSPIVFVGVEIESLINDVMNYFSGK